MEQSDMDKNICNDSLSDSISHIEELAAKVDLSDIQQVVDLWIKSVGVRYFSPLTNMAVLAEETGEVARQMARIYGEQSFKPGEEPHLADELADLLWVLVAIANQTGTDLTEAFKNNLLKKTVRDKDRHLLNEKLKHNP